MAFIGEWRDRVWGHDVTEPNWDEVFADPDDQRDAVRDAIEEQKRLIAEVRAKHGGQIGRR